MKLNVYYSFILIFVTILDPKKNTLNFHFIQFVATRSIWQVKYIWQWLMILTSLCQSQKKGSADTTAVSHTIVPPPLPTLPPYIYLTRVDNTLPFSLSHFVTWHFVLCIDVQFDSANKMFGESWYKGTDFHVIFYIFSFLFSQILAQ